MIQPVTEFPVYAEVLLSTMDLAMNKKSPPSPHALINIANIIGQMYSLSHMEDGFREVIMQRAAAGVFHGAVMERRTRRKTSEQTKGRRALDNAGLRQT